MKKKWVKKDETNQKQCKAEITYFTDFNIMSNHTHIYIQHWLKNLIVEFWLYRLGRYDNHR